MKRPWQKYSKKTVWKEQNIESKKIYNTVYNTRRWRNLSKYYLKKNPLCVMCKAKNKITQATLTDHKVAIKNGGPVWDWSNFQALCAKCHAVKTNKDRNKK